METISLTRTKRRKETFKERDDGIYGMKGRERNEGVKGGPPA